MDHILPQVAGGSDETSTGRATVIALRLNNDYVVEARALWIESNWHPPT